MWLMLTRKTSNKPVCINADKVLAFHKDDPGTRFTIGGNSKDTLVITVEESYEVILAKMMETERFVSP